MLSFSCSVVSYSLQPHGLAACKAFLSLPSPGAQTQVHQLSDVIECLINWPQIKKIVILKCHFLLLYTTKMNYFLIRLWHVMKSGFYMTTGNYQLSGWTKKKFQSTSKSQTCTKKGSWSLFGGLLPAWSTTAFWIPAKSLHLRSMLSKLMSHTENCKACSQH